MDKNKTILKVKQNDTLMNFIENSLPELNRKKLKVLLKNKMIFVNDIARTKFDYQLFKNDIVTVNYKMHKLVQENVLDIIYEDDSILVINKPEGLLSVATDNEKEVTAYMLLMDYVRFNNKNARVHIVHRLDKDTSGVFMVAKNEKVKKMLQENWNKNIIKRGYYAVVSGAPTPKSGKIESNLIEAKNHMVYSTKKDEGQRAITHYKVIAEKGGLSLVDINIKTGRKNQIRVHMKDLGSPIVGDKKYSSKVNPIKRMGLHAYELSFVHPITKKEVSFISDIPKEFKKLF